MRIDRDIAIDEAVVLVLVNLCRNAAEAGATRVRCSLDLVGDVLHGSVDDDGPGIDPRDVEHAFTLGYTSKPDPTGTGRGIGLAVVRRAVTERGGEILVTRSAWGGTRFEFDMAAPR